MQMDKKTIIEIIEYVILLLILIIYIALGGVNGLLQHIGIALVVVLFILKIIGEVAKKEK